MRGQRTIVIDGHRYDAATGTPVGGTRSTHVPRRAMDVMPARRPARTQQDPVKVEQAAQKTSQPNKKRIHTPAVSVHGKPQRSQTLHRSPLKKPEVKHAGEIKRQRAIVAKSPHISKFAPQPQPERKKNVQQEKLAPAVAHPKVTKALQKKHQAKAQHAAISSRAIKEQLIKEQLDNADTKRQYKDHKTPKQRSKKGRFISLASAALALIVLGGYLTYLNMPGLSIRVAAVQAGIDASLPEYHPSGYRFNGPITFANGEVALGYQANGGPHSYNITQKASDWDSQAVLDNYVLTQSDGNYNIHSTQGLTVYTFGTKAVWVNRGILHEVDYSNAPLSYDQIERIAASM